MLYHSTSGVSEKVNLRNAVLNPIAPDNGLYMPEGIPKFSSVLLKNIDSLSFPELSIEVARLLVGNNIQFNDLKTIVENAINIEAPLVYLDDSLASLELWHGESMSFKDFGARFMSNLLSYFLKGENREQILLVATSGDTGGAVAAGFQNVPGVKVVILYPKGRVSPFQKKQLTTFGGNISALEVNGSFDDCQNLVKSAFLDNDLKKSLSISSANSINIARLIPQTFYFFEAYKQITNRNKPIIISVPSGNFGNLTAGLIARRMGLPIYKFVASTNINKVVPVYLNTGEFNPIDAFKTLSNAMDVGNPNNFVRIMDLYGSTWNHIIKDIDGFWLNDEGTRNAIKVCFDKYHYMIEPHSSIAYAAIHDYSHQYNKIFLSTAHPYKFNLVIESILNINMEVPESVSKIFNKKEIVTCLKGNYEELKSFLLKL